MHLHPQWQQTILSDLHAIFPEAQFIVSFHAPAVINSVPREQIRILQSQGHLWILRESVADSDTYDSKIFQIVN